MKEQDNLFSRSLKPLGAAGRALINRYNMGRLFVFNIFACIIVLFLTVVFSVFNILLIPESYQTSNLLLFALVLGLSALTVYLSSVNKLTHLFLPVVLSYLGIFSALMFNFAFRAENNFIAVVLCWITLLVQATLPILRPTEFAAFLGADLIIFLILIFVRDISGESILTLISVSAMSALISIIAYFFALTKLDFQLSINSALNQAETDPMTQLLNRRGLDRRIDSIWPHCNRSHTCVAVLMIDIDNFKKYNDSFGHAAGDECIKAVSGAIRKTIRRKTDYGARVGGEEFLVFLTNIEPKDAVKWGLNLKKAIDDLKIPHAKTNFNPYVSVSLGLACSLVTEETTFDMLKEEADKSLYDAKNNGRNRLYYHHKCFGAPKKVKL